MPAPMDACESFRSQPRDLSESGIGVVSRWSNHAAGNDPVGAVRIGAVQANENATRDDPFRALPFFDIRASRWAAERALAGLLVAGGRLAPGHARREAGHGHHEIRRHVRL